MPIPVNKKPTKADIRKFSLTILIGMPVAGALWTGLVWLMSDALVIWIFLLFTLLGLIVFGISILSASAGRVAYITWHTLAAILELAISLLSTFIMYYLTLVPIALIMRLCGRKPLAVKFDRTRKSYWKDCQEEPELKRYFRQY